MPKNTLSPVGFDTSRIAKTHLNGQELFAMACAYGSAKHEMPYLPQATFVRTILLAGLETVGWTEERMIEEYAAWRVSCLRDGSNNPYESE